MVAWDVQCCIAAWPAFVREDGLGFFAGAGRKISHVLIGEVL